MICFRQKIFSLVNCATLRDGIYSRYCIINTFISPMIVPVSKFSLFDSKSLSFPCCRSWPMIIGASPYWSQAKKDNIHQIKTTLIQYNKLTTFHILKSFILIPQEKIMLKAYHREILVRIQSWSKCINKN